MDNIEVIEVEKILKDILYKIDSIKYNGQCPDKIIIGSSVFYLLQCYFSHELKYNNSNNECKLYGIPVMIDRYNPWNVEVCICFKVM